MQLGEAFMKMVESLCVKVHHGKNTGKSWGFGRLLRAKQNFSESFKNNVICIFHRIQQEPLSPCRYAVRCRWRSTWRFRRKNEGNSIFCMHVAERFYVNESAEKTWTISVEILQSANQVISYWVKLLSLAGTHLRSEENGLRIWCEWTEKFLQYYDMWNTNHW